MSVDVEIDFGTVTLTTNEAGFIGYQVDGYGEEESGVGDHDHFQPFGFLSRPLDPDADGTGATCIYLRRGNETVVLPGYDARAIEKIPVLKKGASVQHNALGGFAHFENDGTNSTWTCYVPTAYGATAATRAHVVTVGVDGNSKETLNLVHASGMSIVMLRDGANESLTLANSAGTCSIILKDTGEIVINGTKITIYGPTQVGGLGGLPVLVGTPPGIPSTSFAVMP